ncbi:MAG: MBL fold metallo-hydrolase [Paludibacteraceae bacterium]|nr:MBL fold metallo-hydrolase [Paludibacteraceae bacterium]
MQVKTFYFNLFRECTYLLIDDNGSALLIDCGCSDRREQQRLEQFVSANALTIKYHLLTHAHIDHIYGARFVYEKYRVMPLLSSKDDWLFRVMPEQANIFGVPLLDKPLTEYVPIESRADDNLLLNLELIDGGCVVKIIPTPGHSEGSVCYWFEKSNMLFSGDTIFQGGFGRTDLPGGNYQQLMESLNKLYLLPEDTIVLPGHGNPTTIKDERNSRINFF